jgi:HK97 family phage major capsid protein
MEALAAPENKALDTAAPGQRDDHDAFMRDYEEYKHTNDARLAAMETRVGVDPLIGDKLARMDRSLDQRLDAMQPKFTRPRLDGASAFATEHKAAFDAYVRRGEAAGGFERKALSTAPDTSGGYTVSTDLETEIGRRLAAISPIRSVAAVRLVSSAVYRKPFATSGFAVGWVGETAARPQTDTPALDALDFPAMELYAMPAASPSLLEDSAVDLEQWILGEIDIAFAEQEGAAFVAGNGVARPKGFLAYDQIADASWTWGKIGTVNSGAAAGFAASNPSDRLVDLVYSLRAGYRQNGAFVMNRKTQAEIRKFKDSTGHYLWQPPAQAGGRASLMTFPVVEAEDMPDIAANATPVAFGDFQRGYLVVDRAGVRVLRDPYSAKPWVLFYVTKRVGGGVQDFGAIKLLKIAA